MPFKKSDDQADLVTAPTCIQLRSKAMYVAGDPKNPELPDEEGSKDYCWCNLTQHVIGPDGEHVDRRSCIAGRSCCERTH